MPSHGLCVNRIRGSTRGPCKIKTRRTPQFFSDVSGRKNMDFPIDFPMFSMAEAKTWNSRAGQLG